MRQFGLLIIVGALLAGTLGTLMYHFVRSIMTMVEDRKTKKELEQLVQNSETRREEKRRQNKERLDNGCDHLWGAMITGFPTNACRKCGLEQERPQGHCDHEWQIEMASVPYGFCRKCNKRYSNQSLFS